MASTDYFSHVCNNALFIGKKAFFSWKNKNYLLQYLWPICKLENVGTLKRIHRCNSFFSHYIVPSKESLEITYKNTLIDLLSNNLFINFVTLKPWQFFIFFRCRACGLRPWCSTQGGRVLRLSPGISINPFPWRWYRIRYGNSSHFQNPRRISRPDHEYLFGRTFSQSVRYSCGAL